MFEFEHPSTFDVEVSPASLELTLSGKVFAALSAHVNHDLARRIPLDVHVVSDFGFQPDISHRLLPCRPMPGALGAEAIVGEQMGILVAQRFFHGLLSLENSVGEPYLIDSKIRDSRRNS